jgi:hypothetical protein
VRITATTPACVLLHNTGVATRGGPPQQPSQQCKQCQWTTCNAPKVARWSSAMQPKAAWEVADVPLHLTRHRCGAVTPPTATATTAAAEVCHHLVGEQHRRVEVACQLLQNPEQRLHGQTHVLWLALQLGFDDMQHAYVRATQTSTL